MLETDRGSVAPPNYEGTLGNDDESHIGKCCGCIPLKLGHQILGVFYTFMAVFCLVMWIRTFAVYGSQFKFEYYVFEFLLLLFYVPMAIIMLIWQFKKENREDT